MLKQNLREEEVIKNLKAKKERRANKANKNSASKNGSTKKKNAGAASEKPSATEMK